MLYSNDLNYYFNMPFNLLFFFVIFIMKVEGNAKYFKITTIDDLEMARLIVKGYEKI